MRSIYLSLLLLFSFQLVVAEDSTLSKFPKYISLSASIGNNFQPLGQRPLFSSETTYSDVTNTGEIDYTMHNWTRGIGWTRRVSADIGLTDWLELGIGYYSVNSELRQSSNSLAFQNGSESVVSTQYINSSELESFELGFKLLKDLKAWKLYLGMDVILPMRVEDQRHYETNSNGSILISVTKNEGGQLIGLNQCLGAEIKIFDKMSALFEFNANWINYQPAKWYRIRYEKDGVSELEDIKRWQKEARYEKGMSKPTGPYGDNEQGLLNQVMQPFGAMGLSFGLKYVFRE